MSSLGYQLEGIDDDYNAVVHLVQQAARARQLEEQARQAVKEEASLERLRSLTSELQQIYHSLGAGQARQGAGGPSTSAGNGAEGREAPGDDDDVIDAEFTAS